MRMYKINVHTKIFTIIFLLLMCWLGSFIFFDKEAVLYQKSVGFLFMLGPFLSYFLFSEKILVNDDKIAIYQLPIAKFFKKGWEVKKFLRWNEIEELKSIYILYPESPIIILKPKDGVKKNKMEILLGGMGGMDISLLKDIIARLPAGTPVSLYPYLKEMLQRKPYSKRKVIGLAVMLILTILSGFLLVWFSAGNIAIILSLIMLVALLFATSIWHK